ncbi:hypothetical protein BJ170DRAFT_65852 [Xylariales sp. AK1849]|nr:hypothetical protein BJ170DRAFT_65852 [Xylariales sp. AK1849]
MDSGFGYSDHPYGVGMTSWNRMMACDNQITSVRDTGWLMLGDKQYRLRHIHTFALYDTTGRLGAILMKRFWFFFLMGLQGSCSGAAITVEGFRFFGTNYVSDFLSLSSCYQICIDSCLSSAIRVVSGHLELALQGVAGCTCSRPGGAYFTGGKRDKKGFLADVM